MIFTFYCLVKHNDSYVLLPYINVYNNMIETINYKNP